MKNIVSKLYNKKIVKIPFKNSNAFDKFNNEGENKIVSFKKLCKFSFTANFSCIKMKK